MFNSNSLVLSSFTLEGVVEFCLVLPNARALLADVGELVEGRRVGHETNPRRVRLSVKHFTQDNQLQLIHRYRLFRNHLEQNTIWKQHLEKSV